MLDGRLSWEELLLSLRVSADRNPDRYNEFLMVFLRFANPESYRVYVRHERRKRFDERAVVEHDDCRYEIQRFCPHAMADLAQGEIQDGSVVCPGHGWAFRLSDGHCPTNESRISVRRLPPEGADLPGPDHSDAEQPEPRGSRNTGDAVRRR